MNDEITNLRLLSFYLVILSLFFFFLVLLIGDLNLFKYWYYLFFALIWIGILGFGLFFIVYDSYKYLKAKINQ